jgi:predicted phage gp36 major capsid-like protein
MSWDAVERSVKRSREDLERDEREQNELLDRLAELRARIVRKRKVLELAQKRSTEQALCLAREMAAEGEDVYQTVLDVSMFEAQLDDSFGGTSSTAPDTK